MAAALAAYRLICLLTSGGGADGVDADADDEVVVDDGDGRAAAASHLNDAARLNSSALSLCSLRLSAFLLMVMMVLLRLSVQFGLAQLFCFHLTSVDGTSTRRR